MIYTFAISFNGSDYQNITPVNFPKITHEKEAEDYIWRAKMDEIKISKAYNSTVYELLEDWWEDSTKYNLNIRIRIQKNSVTKWSFIFGIKQGEIDYELKNYKVQPSPEDQYTDLMAYKGLSVTNANPKTYFYVNEDDIDSDGVDEYYKATQYRYYDWINACKTKLNLQTVSSDYSIQSAFLWGDAYPDGGTYNDLPTLSSDFAIRQSTGGAGYMTIDHLLNVPKQFQCYYHVASDYTIHFEHVGWYYNQLTDYQIDLTGSDYYDDARMFRYSTPEYYAVERFGIPTDSVVLADYGDASIYYDPNMIGYANQEREYRTDYDAYLTSDFVDKFMATGDKDNLCVGWNNVSGWTNWTHSSDSADITDGDANGSGNVARTNLVAAAGDTVTIGYEIDFEYESTPPNVVEIRGYTDGTANGASWTSLGVGVNSGSVTGNHIRFRSTGTQDFNFTIKLTISNYYRIPWADGIRTSTRMQNMDLSWANILNEYWLYDRYAHSGYMNGAASDFQSTKFLKEQEEFKFYYAGDLDPMRGVKTDYGTGMIQSMTRDLATDFITLKLRYE